MSVPARRGRLSRSAEFDRVYRQGRSFGGRYLVLYAFPTGDGQAPRVGLSVSRKVGGAVERNRVKRLLRELFVAREAELRAGHDLVVVARPEARELAERDGLTGLASALDELLVKAGVSGSRAQVPTGEAAMGPGLQSWAAVAPSSEPEQ